MSEHAGCVGTRDNAAMKAADASHDRSAASMAVAAAAAGELETMRSFLVGGGDPLAIDAYGVSMLSNACAQGRTDCVRMLLEGDSRAAAVLAGAAGSVGGEAEALARACEGAHVDCVRRMLDHGFGERELKRQLESHLSEPTSGAAAIAIADHPLAAASKGGSAEVVGMLIAVGLNPNLCSGSRHAAYGQAQADSPLGVAAQLGHCDVVRVLLQANAAVDAPGKGGETPLKGALRCKQAAAAELLRAAGATEPQKRAPPKFGNGGGAAGACPGGLLGQLSKGLAQGPASVVARSREQGKVYSEVRGLSELQNM
jgi:hypothetical protein